MKRDYALLLAVVFLLGYIVGMQAQSSAAPVAYASSQTPTPQITLIVEEPLTLERAVTKHWQSLTATPTALPDNVMIITATQQPSATPRPVIVNDQVTVY